MSGRDDEFPLLVHVPADQWAYTRRRMAYLEAVLVHILQDRNRIQEWYDATELAALRLPGLPATRAGVTRIAKRGDWLRREVTAQGGRRFQYHYTSLPSRAFDSLIARILDVPQPDAPGPAAPEVKAPQTPDSARDDNTAPPWVLPFMRLMKGEARGDLSAAWRALPKHLPPGVPLPTQEEAAETILRLGLSGRA